MTDYAIQTLALILAALLLGLIILNIHNQEREKKRNDEMIRNLYSEDNISSIN